MAKEYLTQLNPPFPIRLPMNLPPIEFVKRIVQSQGLSGKSASLMITDEYGSQSKFAPVCPPRIYQAMREAGYIPSNVLLLAHDVVANKDLYETEFVRSEWLHTNIIMDNSLIETGGAVDAEMVYTAASTVGADVVVLPDVLRDGIASTKATLKAWAEWHWKFRDFQKMIVIQGSLS